LELPAQIQSADPAQQLMFLQMQQNAVLLQKLVTKHSDPVLGALSGGSASDSGGGSSSGVKGCLAREVLLRAVQDLTKVADSTRANLLRELGIPASREDGNLMRKYVERKIPLAEHRLLSQVAFMIAESWNIGFESQNIELLGVLSLMMYFVEQAAIEQGRTQTAWLLCGWQEPPYQILVSHKRRSGLQQFCRICNPSWISANLAYVKDLDYMESRLSANAKGSKAIQPLEDEPSAQPKRRPQKGRGKGKQKSQQGEDASNSTEA